MNNLNNKDYFDKSFGVGSRLFALIFLYYASRGSDTIFFITIFAFFLLITGMIIKNFRFKFSSYSILLILIVLINFLMSLLAPEASFAYISSQCIWLIIAIIGINLEKFFFQSESKLSKYLVWGIGLFLILIYIAAIINPTFLWLFENLFLPKDSEVSRYSSGAVRFYTVAAVCFLIIPVKGFKKFYSFVINALPLSPINILSWFFLHVTIRKLIITSFFLILFILLYLQFQSISFLDELTMFISDKSLSVNSRLEKFSDLDLIGSSVSFNDDFSETFWIALAQSNGIILSLLFFIIFFYNIVRLSNNVLFIAGALILTAVNPFPLALIYLLADSWNNNIDNE